MLSDGGLATELERRGVRLDSALWSAGILRSNPPMIRDIHEAFYRAGSCIATTASYQLSLEGLQAVGCPDNEIVMEFERLLKLSVDLACEARETVLGECADPKPDLLVAASMGPYGAHLGDCSEYHGKYGVGPGALPVSDLMEFHKHKMAVLAGTRADVLALETIPCIADGVALATLLAENHPEKRAWISFTGTADGITIASGELLADAVVAVEAIAGKQLMAVGVNCCPPKGLHEAVTAIQGAGGPYASVRRIIVYPNSGEVYEGNSWAWKGEAGTQDEFVSVVASCAAAGAVIVGGCCRTTPEHIALLRSVLTA